mgnify:CR=1 FL=1
MYKRQSLHRLKESLLAAPIIWKGEYPYFIHPLTDGVPRLNPSVLTAVVEIIETSVEWQSIDLIVGIEAMGLPLTSPLSMRNNRPQVVVRKRSYGLEGEVAIDQSTGYSKGTMYLNDIKENERVLIVDDVLSTGGTLDAIILGVEAIGADIQSVIVVVEKGPGLQKLQKKYPKLNIVILENDAKDLSNEIPDGSIDKLLAINVIYFLKPIEEYILEFKRILKKGGIGYLGCKFESIKNFDIEVAPNRDEGAIIAQLLNLGFSASSEFIDLGEDRSRYTLIKFEKL